MPFGNFSSADMPTDYGAFRIHVLPELIPLGTKNGRPVAALAEHYAMQTENYRPMNTALFHLHQTSLYQDLFLPAMTEGENAPQKILRLLNQTSGGILLYIESLQSDVLGRLKEGLDSPASHNPSTAQDIIEAFARHPEISTSSVAWIPSQHDQCTPAPFADIAIHRFDETAEVFMPQEMRARLFPNGMAAETILRKNLSHYALVRPIQDHEALQAPYVRVHSSCATGDINGAHTCDCGVQFRKAMQTMLGRGGAIIYDDAEGRGVLTLAGKMAFYDTHAREGLDTYDAMTVFGYSRDASGYGPDLRTYAGATTLMKALGLTHVTLGTNNPHKLARIRARGIAVVDTSRVLADFMPDPRREYLKAKERKGGHLLRKALKL